MGTRHLLLVSLLVVGIEWTSGELGARPPSASELTSLPIEALIGRFQQESEQTVGANTSVSLEGFIGADVPLSFGVELLGVPTPKVSPVMRELVRRGLAALPTLLDHLTDARPTKLLIAVDHNFGTQFFTDEYDPKDFTTEELPAGVRRPSGGSDRDEIFAEYRVRVGDLCYATLGQIVGRRLNAARYQPSGLFYVNSPVRTPALAAATRAEWTGVTAQEFTAYLVRDLERNEANWNNMNVLRRLLFYDHSMGIAQAVRLLNRGVYNPKPVSDLTTKLWATADEQEREKLLDNFWATHDESTRRATEQAVAGNSTPLTPEDIEIFPEGATMQKRAAELAARRFPEANRTPSFSQLWLTCGNQCEVVETVSTEPSSEIDAAVRDLCNRTLALRADDTEDKLSQCRLAVECAKRFVPARRWKEITRMYGKLRPNDIRAMEALLRTLAAEPALWSTARPR